MVFKKKITYELETYFPSDFISLKEKSSYDKIKSRTLLVLEAIRQDVDNTESIELIDLELLKAYEPRLFIGSESAEILHDKHFESTCLLIMQKSGMDARSMTVLQFYSAVSNIKQQIEAETKRARKYNKGGH